MSLEIKSYLQECPRKKVLVENAWEQRMFSTLQKKGQLVLKIPLDIYADAQRKSPFYKSVTDLISFSQDFGFFFFRTLIPVILFAETLLAAPILFQEKNSQESKTQDCISSDILSQDFRKLGIFAEVFNSRFFIQKLFFPVTFFLRFVYFQYYIVQVYGYHGPLIQGYILNLLHSSGSLPLPPPAPSPL